MNCPKDLTPMREREREASGEKVVMDVCPTCGGIWLDRGELEKLTAAEQRYYRRADRRPERYDRYGDDDDDDYGGSFGGERRHRGGFLDDIFGGFGD